MGKRVQFHAFLAFGTGLKQAVCLMLKPFCCQENKFGTHWIGDRVDITDGLKADLMVKICHRREQKPDYPVTQPAVH
jgi:hypothetical protein